MANIPDFQSGAWSSILHTRTTHEPLETSELFWRSCYNKDMGIIRKWDFASKEVQDKCASEIITRIEYIEDNQVGLIAAQDIIDIVTDNLAPEIYNKAIFDAKKLLEDRMNDLEAELDLLKV